MAVYDYSCKKCGRVFEYKVPFEKLETVIKCPAGCKTSLKREISAPAFFMSSDKG